MLLDSATYERFYAAWIQWQERSLPILREAERQMSVACSHFRYLVSDESVKDRVTRSTKPTIQAKHSAYYLRAETLAQFDRARKVHDEALDELRAAIAQCEAYCNTEAEK